jgi:riboflavin kinase/FMN adenylyltransferase
MRLFNALEEIRGIEGTVIALGNFDGVHIGHQALIERTVKEASAANLKSAVFTFANHPRNVLSSRGKKVKCILYPDEKAAIIERLGVDYMFNINFDEKIQQMEPVEFINGLLIAKLYMQEACCGFNYRFGAKAAGNIEVLMKESIKKHFGIHVIEPVRIDGEVVSSTLIRKIIESGDVENCMKYMGRHYALDGEVVIGNRLGKSIGFPTSNIIIDESMAAPSNGVCLHRRLTILLD